MKEDKNFEIAWKTIRNNQHYVLPEEMDEQDQDLVWELRKQWFTFGWNNSAAFKNDKVIYIGEKKPILEV
jgi:hypothetical protein